MSKNIFTTEAFAEWTAKQGNQDYQFNCGNCAIAQYLTSKGLQVTSIGYRYWRDNNEAVSIPAGWSEAANQFPHNFQDLTTRLKALR